MLILQQTKIHIGHFWSYCSYNPQISHRPSVATDIWAGRPLLTLTLTVVVALNHICIWCMWHEGGFRGPAEVILFIGYVIGENIEAVMKTPRLFGGWGWGGQNVQSFDRDLTRWQRWISSISVEFRNGKQQWSKNDDFLVPLHRFCFIRGGFGDDGRNIINKIDRFWWRFA